MKVSKNEPTMSNPERIAILETTILYINSTLLDNLSPLSTPVLVL